ncbi:MAG: flavodoxin-dependent (E)-4-hydroxy-3-methylbut-2-enyl-diphosphate synthase [Candidatus Ancillula sp.]|jgi:(E)-4-hydroxy-3-methylbut-2-enyl-diphosphate synthase|nr:flavodoxin-dependent (E)-4-hydroxy-3-methylbut-2-enyl-diphosphate synthase [Candidatus Ancillula sp.]
MLEDPFNRKKTRKLWVGDVAVGGDSPISVQSMTTTRTYDVEATVQQIRELALAGCDIIRIACPTISDADALPEIVKQSPIPVIVDIHFQADFALKAIKAGAAAVRINPGNLARKDEELPLIISAAKANKIPLRIGVNAGSLDKEILAKYNGKVCAEALVDSAMQEANEFEKLGFEDFAISVKHHDPVLTIETYKLLSSKIDCPLHLGVTEAGPQFQGTIKSAVAFGSLLSQGIGDTIRVSLSADPAQEVKVGKEILMALGFRERRLEIISCPTCGRGQTDVIHLAKEVEEKLKDHPKLAEKPLKVAVMGCVVNGPGEAREANIGVAGGAGKGKIFVKGKVIKTVATEEIIPTLLAEIENL